jgi:hypothetical protein
MNSLSFPSLSKIIVNIASITVMPPRTEPAIVALSPTLRPPDPDPESDELDGEEEAEVVAGVAVACSVGFEVVDRLTLTPTAVQYRD